MFTRYQGIKFPDNYGGSLFNKNIAEDTQTKVHKPNIYGATSTTVSPAFEATYKKSQASDEENTPKENDNTEKIEITPHPVDNLNEKDTYQTGNGENCTADNCANSFENEKCNEYSGDGYGEPSNCEYESNDLGEYANNYGEYSDNGYGEYANDGYTEYEDSNGKMYYENGNEYIKSEGGCAENSYEEQKASGELSVEKRVCDGLKDEKEHPKKDIRSFKISDILGKVNSDELIILCIILLIASEGNHESDDILPILALLLLSKK